MAQKAKHSIPSSYDTNVGQEQKDLIKENQGVYLDMLDYFLSTR